MVSETAMQTRRTNQKLEQQYFDPLMPNDVTFAEVLGLTEVLGENGSRMPTSATRGRPVEILSLLASAKMLDLVSTEPDGRLLLTNLGLGFLRAEFPEKMGILRVRLSTIEPFKSTLELLSYKKSVVASEIVRRLSEKYSTRNFDEKRVLLVLIEWGLSTSLLKYTGSSFQLNDSRIGDSI